MVEAARNPEPTHPLPLLPRLQPLLQPRPLDPGLLQRPLKCPLCSSFARLRSVDGLAEQLLHSHVSETEQAMDVLTLPVSSNYHKTPSSYPSSAIQGSRSSYRERKGNPDVPGLEIPVYKGNRIIFYLVDRTVTTKPLNKSPFPSQRGAGLGFPAAGYSAPAGHSGTAAAPCVPRLARRGRTSPGRGDPCAALTCSHRRGYRGSEAGAQPRGSVSVVRRLAPPRTAALLEHRSRDATKKSAPTPCPEPPPSSPIPERSPRSLAACEALGEGGAGRRYRARVGSGRAEGGVSSLRMGRRGEAAARAAPPCRQPPARDRGRAPCLLPTSFSRCVLSPRGMDRSPELGATGGFRSLSGGRKEVLVTGDIAGVLEPELGIIFCRRHPSTTMMKTEV
ncbi:uncharacterized protein LOC128117201 [Peromyscus californicus insignis]|uniref:uncharacterized protein LOC128117201 n=1 Tax=Peromyscus californicus insignis TaxID=564181 RepID=UPI0022A7D191|nr:uncharacterized protein LOC128117201 [Peromyscus californicus insignis]